MTPIKTYIARQFLGKKFHFKCDCVMPIDVIGIVKDADTLGKEIVLLVDNGSKLVHIGLNASTLVVEELE